MPCTPKMLRLVRERAFVTLKQPFTCNGAKFYMYFVFKKRKKKGGDFEGRIQDYYGRGEALRAHHEREVPYDWAPGNSRVLDALSCLYESYFETFYKKKNWMKYIVDQILGGACCAPVWIRRRFCPLFEICY